MYKKERNLAGNIRKSVKSRVALVGCDGWMDGIRSSWNTYKLLASSIPFHFINNNGKGKKIRSNIYAPAARSVGIKESRSDQSLKYVHLSFRYAFVMPCHSISMWKPFRFPVTFPSHTCSKVSVIPKKIHKIIPDRFSLVRWSEKWITSLTFV